MTVLSLTHCNSYIVIYQFQLSESKKGINILTTDDKYSCHNRENLPLPIQIQLSQKSKTFCSIFIALESTLDFENFEEKNAPQSLKVTTATKQ